MQHVAEQFVRLRREKAKRGVRRPFLAVAKGGVASIQNTNARQGNRILLFHPTHMYCVISVILH